MGSAILTFAAITILLQVANAILVIEKQNGEKVSMGSPGNITEMPWLVSLTISGYSNTASTFTRNCLGTIISETQILTSASCIKKKGTAMTGIKIMMGRNSQTNSDEGGETISFSSFKGAIAHEAYTDFSDVHNIALINVPHPLPIAEGSNINSIKMPPDNAFGPRSDDPVSISGWGDTTGDVGEDLQTGRLMTLSRVTCAREDTSWDEKTKMCAAYYEDGDFLTTPCQADIGGPLVFDDLNLGKVLVGVVTTPTCEDIESSVFAARVGGYLDWIVANSV